MENPFISDNTTSGKLVTIGIPVYNAEPYIKQCLLSVLNQTYLEIEILIIDDKGTDTSMYIVRSIQAEHPRGKCIRIIENDQNEGVGISRNKLIENALGEYFFFLDADDEISLNCIELMHNKIVSLDVDMVCGSFRTHYSEDKFEDFVIKGSVVRGEKILIEFFRPHNSMFLWNKLYKTSLLKGNHIHCPSRIFEDVNMSFQIFSVIHSCCDISDITYFHHSRPNSISSGYDSKNDISIVLGLDSFFAFAHNKIQTLDPAYRIKIKEKFFATRLSFSTWILGGKHEHYIKNYLNRDYLRDGDHWKSPILFSFYIFSLMPLGIQKKLIPFLLKAKKQLNTNR